MRAFRTVPLLVLLALALTVAPAGAARRYVPKALPSLGVKTSSFAIVDRGRSVGLKSRLVRSLPRRGASVGLSCSDVPDPLGGASSELGTSTTVRRGIRLQIPKGFDFCVAKVVVVKRTRRSESTTTPAEATIALNPAGEEFLNTRGLAFLMDSATDLAFDGVPKHRTPTSAQIAEVLDGTSLLGKRLQAVATPAPDTQVPAGTIGVFFDGTRTSMTATTPGGHHLFLDYDRSTQAVSTNVLAALNDTTGDRLLTND